MKEQDLGWESLLFIYIGAEAGRVWRDKGAGKREEMSCVIGCDIGWKKEYAVSRRDERKLFQEKS